MHNLAYDYKNDAEIRAVVDKWAKRNILPAVIVGYIVLTITVIDLISQYLGR